MPPLRTWHLSAGLLALTIGAYLPLWNNDFIDFDDQLYITQNPYVIAGLSSADMVWAWTNCHAKYWQPVSWLSLQLDAQLSTERPAAGPPILWAPAFHGQNLFWHAASVLLLFALGERLTGRRGCAFLVAALFAIHPLHGESVAWAAERKDVLSVFFGLLAVWCYVRYVAAPDRGRYLALMGAYLLSLLCKPMLITLPFVLLLLDYWPLGRLLAVSTPQDTDIVPARPGVRRLLLEKIPLFVMAAVIAVVTLTSREITNATIPLQLLPISARLANAGTAYGWYLTHTIWPQHLAVLYPHPLRNWSAGPMLAGTAAVLGLTLLALWQARRRPWLLVGWLWFVGTLLPVIGLVQGGQQAWADRFTYWPHIGLLLALVGLAAELAGRLRIPRPIVLTAAATVVAALAARTWTEVGYWHDTLTLWTQALAVNPDNYWAHVSLAGYYMDRGEVEATERHYAEAFRLRPDAQVLHYCRGISLLGLGRVEEAEGHFRAMVAKDPADPEGWFHLGLACLRQEKSAEAMAAFEKVLALQPQAHDALACLGLAQLQANQRGAALDTLRRASRVDSPPADAWYGLGEVYLASGCLDKAAAALTEAVRLNPLSVNAQSALGLALVRQGDAEGAVPHHQLAVRLQEDGEKAVRHWKGRAPPLDGMPQAVVVRCRLAYALAQAGNPQAAALVYQAALSHDPAWPSYFRDRARVLVADPDPERRDPQLAYELATQAAALDPSPATLDVLAASEAALGRYADAARTAQNALDRLAGTQSTVLARALQENLRLYQSGKPQNVPGREPSP